MANLKSILNTVIRILKSPRTRDRRKFPRRKKVYIAEIELSGQRNFMTVTNLSKEGMGVCLNEKIKTGSLIKVFLSHEYTSGTQKGKKINLTLPAKVVWTKQVKSKKEEASAKSKEDTRIEFDTGLKLMPLSKDTRAQYDVLIKELKKEELKLMST